MPETADVAAFARRPIRLPDNPIRRFYRGSGRLAGGADAYLSEEWIGSTTTAAGDTAGPSRLADGTLLADAVAAHPVEFLGAAHVERFGPGTELLVKFLDPGERLPVHCHPTRAFAREHLGCRHGKSEAWIIAAAPDEGGEVFLGFRDDVPMTLLREWVAGQHTERLLGALNRIPVRPGDALFVPAGVPHAIGAGLLVVELQEPTDLSIMLEWDGYRTGEDTGIGLDRETGLRAVDRTAWPPGRLAGLSAPGGSGARRLLPEAADEFFRAELVPPGAPVTLDAGFSILIVTSGQGTLTAGGETHELAAGDKVLVPHACGDVTVTGTASLIRCRPPRP